MAAAGGCCKDDVRGPMVIRPVYVGVRVELRKSVGADYYDKKTSGWLVSKPMVRVRVWRKKERKAVMMIRIARPRGAKPHVSIQKRLRTKQQKLLGTPILFAVGRSYWHNCITGGLKVSRGLDVDASHARGCAPGNCCREDVDTWMATELRP